MKKNAAFLFLALCFTFTIGCNRYGVIMEGGDRGPVVTESAKGPPPWAPAHGYRAKYKYRYYPNHSVYYDTGRHIYFHYEGGRWRVSASLPIGIRLGLTDYVTLEMGTDRPYKYHRDVERRYPPGQLKKKGRKNKKNKWK